MQGLSWAAGGVAQALLPVSKVWSASSVGTGRSACATPRRVFVVYTNRHPIPHVDLDAARAMFITAVVLNVCATVIRNGA